MAADITLIALPNTPGNWHRARLQSGIEFYDDDNVVRGADGEILGIEYTDRRRDLDLSIHEDADTIELGPVSFWKADTLQDQAFLPAPTIAAAQVWMRPRLVTPAWTTATMVAMNLPDRSHYRDRRNWRRPRRQHVKRWLGAHGGWVVWAETW